jgi:hypothetical protein
MLRPSLALELVVREVAGRPTMNPRNALWPVTAKPDPNTFQRLARVLHWCFAGCAVICVAAVMNPLTDHVMLLVSAIALAMFGRGLRYILAGE